VSVLPISAFVANSNDLLIILHPFYGASRLSSKTIFYWVATPRDCLSLHRLLTRVIQIFLVLTDGLEPSLSVPQTEVLPLSLSQVIWCPRSDLNRQAITARHFKCREFTNFSTRAMFWWVALVSNQA
jgi:hypothetical protein